MKPLIPFQETLEWLIHLQSSLSFAKPSPVQPHPAESKIFCIGFGRTGTTSLESFFRSLGYTLGDQERGELLLREWVAGNFAPIISLAESAQVFQDLPFNLPGTYEVMDLAFPGSKFILSVRRDAEQWFESVVRFHTKLLGRGRIPTAEDLRQFPYRYPGWILESLLDVYGSREADPYCKRTLIAAYEGHNAAARTYFQDKPESLLVVNLSELGTAREIVEFVGLPYRGESLPHLNQS